jgi:hypothetical protein
MLYRLVLKRNGVIIFGRDFILLEKAKKAANDFLCSNGPFNLDSRKDGFLPRGHDCLWEKISLHRQIGDKLRVEIYEQDIIPAAPMSYQKIEANGEDILAKEYS